MSELVTYDPAYGAIIYWPNSWDNKNYINFILFNIQPRKRELQDE